MLRVRSCSPVAARSPSNTSRRTPESFDAAFYGHTTAVGGWFDQFIAFLAEKLKHDEAFKSIYAATHLALLTELLLDVGADQARTLGLADATATHLVILVQQGERTTIALATMVGDVATIREVVEELRARLLTGDQLVPIYLPPADFDASGFLRFSYKNWRLPFRGRSSELAALEAFLSDPRSFTWWLAVGGGGAGKSRLALELCLRQRGVWRAGFLERSRGCPGWDAAALRTWQPSRPTLIVIDYVLARPEQTRELILALARRAGDLHCPVRLLLLERAADDRLEQSLYGSSSDRGEIIGKRYASQPLTVAGLSDDETWELACVFPSVARGNGARLAISRKEFFARLDRVDERRRALSAMILAEALAVDGGRQGFAGLAGELEDLLDRERDHHWPRAPGSTDCAIRDDVEAPILALATMVDGLRKSHLAVLPPEARDLLKRWHAQACAQIVGSTLEGPDPTLARIEPDLVGEFYVLQTLAPKDRIRK